MFYIKGGGDIWSILTLNNVFFLGKMEKTRVAEGGFTYSHNIISIYHPKWWFFGEDQKCSKVLKWKINPTFFFDNRGFPNWGGGGGSAAWEFFPHNPVFLSDGVPYILAYCPDDHPDMLRSLCCSIEEEDEEEEKGPMRATAYTVSDTVLSQVSYIF